MLFYSGDKELLLSLYIRRDATAADVKCVGMLRFGGFEDKNCGDTTVRSYTVSHYSIDTISIIKCKSHLGD